MSDEPTPAWAQALVRTVTDLRESVATREQLAGMRADIMARLDQLQEDLTRRLDGEVVNYGAAQQAERIARGASDEARALGEQVQALARMVRRLEAEVRSLRGEP